MKSAIKIALLVSVLTSCAWCQDNPTDQVGVKPFGSYGVGSIDTINYENGNVFLRIPLFSLPQLGKLSLSYSLILNNKGYTAQLLGCESVDDGGQNCLQQAVRSTGFGPTIVADQFLTAFPTWSYDPYLGGSTNPVWSSWSITDGSGNQTQVGWDSSNLSLAHGLDGGGYTLNPTHGTYNYTSSYDPNCPMSMNDYTLKTASGITYNNSFACDGSNWQTIMSDPNGNALTFYPQYNYSLGGLVPSQGGVVDSVNRVVPNIPNASTDPSILTSCPNLGVANQPALSVAQWLVPGPNGGSSTYLICYTTIGYSTGFYYGWASLDNQTYYWTEANGQASVIQSVVLPNGTYWGFVYDSTTNYQQPIGPGDPNTPTIAYGDLTKLILPTGGSISYTYTNQSSCPSSLPNWAPDRFVHTRTINDANGNSALWQYSYSGPNSGETTTETDPSLNDTQHIFTPLLGSQCSLAETTTKTYLGTASSSNTPTRTTVRHYYAKHDAGAPLSVVNIIPSDQTTTLEDGESTTTTYAYPTLFTQEAEACYSATNCVASMGSAFSFNHPQTTTTTGYGLSTASVSINNYKWQDSASGFLASNWLTALSSTCVPQAGFTTCSPNNSDTAAYTTYDYDGSGNVHNVNKWLGGASSQYITSTSTYTSNGELQSTTDSVGNLTQYTYDPSALGLFPTKIQKPTTNGFDHIDYYTYDNNTGNIKTHVAENAANQTDGAHTTTYTYDLMGRLIDAKYPSVPVGSTSTSENPESIYCYTDLGGSICPKASGPPYQFYSLTTAAPSPSISNMKEFDGLGRPIMSVLLSDPEGPQITDTKYDLLGRVSSTSSAYRTKDDSTYDVATYTYDELSRKKTATHSGDGSSTSWSYLGSSVTFKDELSRQTTSTSDALGRLTTVVDPATLSTTYSYDALGHLTGVHQVGNSSQGDVPRVRTFTYDTLSRLTCASNPESSSSSASCPTIATGGYTPGTLGYSYYPNGNLNAKTDANGVVATSSYDGLNRLLSVVYSNDSASTPSSCFSYDGSKSTNMVGMLAQTWTMHYGSGCPTSPPASPITSKKVIAYNAMGRMLTAQQCVLTMCSTGNPFQLSQSYDLAGNPTTINQTAITGVVPQLQLSNNYDGAGRLSSMESSWNGVPNSSDPLVLYSVQSYSPAGPQSSRLGNNLYIQQTYDSQKRPTSEIVTHP